MKRKNKESGECCMCGKKTLKRLPERWKPTNRMPQGFYCGCKGPRAG